MSILQWEGPDGRVLVFAHNTHVRRSGGESDLGQFLDDLLGNQMIVIGSFFNQGAVGKLGGETRATRPDHVTR